MPEEASVQPQEAHAPDSLVRASGRQGMPMQGDPAMAPSPHQEEAEAMGDDDVIGVIPRYAMPNISSMLPSYTNAEQEFVNRTFNTGNYDFLKYLPDNIKYQQVMAARTTRLEAVRQFLMPALSGPRLKSQAENQQGLFEANMPAPQVFEYIPSRYSLADELASKERVESEAKRMMIGGKEFQPSGTLDQTKHKELAPGKMYPYLGGPYEADDDAVLAHSRIEAAKQLPEVPAFTSPGTDKLTDTPSKANAWEMMNCVCKWITKDWAGADVAIFENHQDCWVLRVAIASIDSVDGFLAYMNVFVRCNELANSYKLTKVVEFWHTMPDDGNAYYVLRPPWVRPDRLHTFFTLHPEERQWQSSHAVLEVQKTQPKTMVNDTAGVVPATTLSYASRLDWGRNFLTGTPAAASLGKMVPGALHE